MNSYLKKIVDIKDLEERFKVIDINTINRIVSLYNKPKVKTKQKLTY